MSLSLPIPKGNSTVSLYHCLDAFVKEEILENDDAWYGSPIAAAADDDDGWL